jgi:hypothetical protein
VFDITDARCNHENYKLFSLPIYKNQGAYMLLMLNDVSHVPIFVSVQLYRMGAGIA